MRRTSSKSESNMVKEEEKTGETLEDSELESGLAMATVTGFDFFPSLLTSLFLHLQLFLVSWLTWSREKRKESRQENVVQRNLERSSNRKAEVAASQNCDQPPLVNTELRNLTKKFMKQKSFNGL